ncbi:AI-2E family transporter [Actinoalloteichus sp. AHMU CJ021]|uniref:AI-2E family transporter n=1 Tax=Actinoalloteichus sp. AHMU CJ021 TaxID=2072503 RepID=UPI00307BE1B5
MSEAKQEARVDPGPPVPRPLQVAAAVCGRLLVVAAAVWVVAWLIGAFSVVVVPVAIALLLAALLAPAVDRLVRWGVPRGVSTALVMVSGLAVLAGVLTFVITAFSTGLPDLVDKVVDSIETIRTWLVEGPLQLQQDQIDDFLGQLTTMLQSNQDLITSGAISTATTVGELLTGLLLALFTLIFFLHDGARIWTYLTGVFSGATRERVRLAGVHGFQSLVGYVRATALVAIVDAVGIGIGLVVLEVPLAIPLAALVFLGAFVPIVGAVVSGLVAVLVALVANGLVTALLVLGVVLLVQQLEGHVLQPLLLGRAVRLHPLAVVLAITVGVVQAGIAGALLAVPLVAVLNAGIKSLRRQAENRPAEDEPAPRLSLPKLSRLNPAKARSVLPNVRRRGKPSSSGSGSSGPAGGSGGSGSSEDSGGSDPSGGPASKDS